MSSQGGTMRKTITTAAVLLVAILWTATAQTKRDNPEVLLGAALHHERVTGNLQAAIEVYRKLLAMKGLPRPLTAQAQYHLGVCYDKLGNQQARQAFERVVRDYADQS